MQARKSSSNSREPKDDFPRCQSPLRRWITADGSSGFLAEPGRYHLYVALACPFAHRTLMMRTLKGLEDVISVDILDWLKSEKGWSFNAQRTGCTPDTVNGKHYMREMYQHALPGFSGRATVPVLWDKKKNTIVNNESSDIIRILNVEFNAFCKTDEERKLDFYPVHLRSHIDKTNEWITRDINYGVYTCGFTTSQAVYDDAAFDLFSALDKVEAILSRQRYLVNSQLTEADIRLFPTLVRFDMVYLTLFKCNRKRITDYKNIWRYVKDIYQMPGIRETVNVDHILNSYYQSHPELNPHRIVPIGPVLDFNALIECEYDNSRSSRSET